MPPVPVISFRPVCAPAPLAPLLPPHLRPCPSAQLLTPCLPAPAPPTASPIQPRPARPSHLPPLPPPLVPPPSQHPATNLQLPDAPTPHPTAAAAACSSEKTIRNSAGITPSRSSAPWNAPWPSRSPTRFSAR